MSYWQKRQEAMYLAGEMKVNKYFTKLEKAFKQTQRELQKTIEAFYFRYAEENGLSYSAAQRKLDKTELGELQDFIELSMKHIGEYNQEVNNLSIKARITRYQALEAQVDAILRKLYAVDYEAEAEKTMQEVYEDTYYQTWYNIDQYRGFHSAFAQVDPVTVETLLDYPFNGADFSSRLWKQKDHLQTVLMESVTTMLVQGVPPQNLAGDVAKKMKSKVFDAYRLLHTESSFLISEATHAGYHEDGVEKYEILATLDSKTCGVCGDLDGNIYAVDEAVVGKNMPPFHCFCRCTDVPYYDDMDLSDQTRAARDPETGETYEVPADMTYHEWRETFINDTLEDSILDRAKKKVKGTLIGEEILNYDELPKIIRKEFEDGLSHSNDLVKTLLKREAAGTQYFVTQSKNSQYTENVNVIGINTEQSRGTIAHELFHRIDDKYKVTRGSNVLNSFISDVENNAQLINDPVSYLMQRYPDAFEASPIGRMRMKENYRGIADIFSALSDGDVKLGYGHKKSYWNEDPNRRAKEIWAEYGRIYYENDNKVMRMLEDLFPSGTSRVNMELKGLMKNVER